jgi:hypothetical protein
MADDFEKNKMKIKELLPKLENALTKFAEDFNSKEENKGKGIHFRGIQKPRRNPVNSCVHWGTERMDKLFPKTKTRTVGDFHGHRYVYAFTFFGGINMKAGFWLSPGELFGAIGTIDRTKMETIASELGGRLLNDDQRCIKYFLERKLAEITSDEQVREIVKNSIAEIIRWEDENLKMIEEILSAYPGIRPG